MNKMNGRRGLATAALAAMVGLASPVFAQQARNFDKPLSTKTAEARQPQSMHIEMQQSNDDDQYSLSIVNGELSAKHNGKALADDRIRRKGGAVELLDENGKVMATFQIGTRNQGGGMGGAGAGAWGAGNAAGGPDAKAPEIVIEQEHPKAMIGIRMADVSDSLLEHLKLEPNTAIMIESIIDELPAAKAGIKAKDIIVEFDGVRPITQEKFREIMKSKNPGDKVAIKVLRKGDTKSLNVQLEGWDNAKLGGDMAPGAATWWGQGDNAKNFAGDAQQRAELMKKFGAQGGGFNQEELQEKIQEMMKQHNFDMGQDGQWLMGVRPGQVELFTPSTDPDAMKNIESRLEKIEKRLEKLTARLERITDLIERSDDEKENR